MKTTILIARILLAFVSSLAPLMFLVGVIAGVDRYGTQQRFVRNLEAYGREAEAVVSYTDWENGRFGVDYVAENGEARYGAVDIRYYPARVWENLQHGDPVRIRYIDFIISGNDRAILAEHYEAVRAYPLVPPDIVWVLGIAWLVVAIKPQFVFLGLVDFDTLLADAVTK